MKQIKVKKHIWSSIIAYLCVFSLMIGMVPAAFATEGTSGSEAVVEGQVTETVVHEHDHEDEADSRESNLLMHLRNEMQAYMEIYGISPEMPDSELANAYIKLDSDASYAAWMTANALMEEAAGLTEQEAEILLEEVNTKLCLRFYAVMEKIIFPVMIAAGASGNPIDGLSVVVTSQNGDDAVENGKVTVSATSTGTSNGCGGTNWTQYTEKITITNTNDSNANISFDWTADNFSSLKIDGTTYNSSSDNFKKEIAGNASITIEAQTGKNQNKATFTMSNFSYGVVKSSYGITVEYPAGCSASVNSNAVDSGDLLQVAAEGVTVSASSDNFIAWIDTANNVALSMEPEFDFVPTSDTTIKALYGPTVHYSVGAKVFENLSDAANGAQNGAGNVIVPLNDGTVPAGEYTIPSGITLLIPFDAANTLYTTTPGEYGTSYATPAKFRQLTMASGAKIIVNGAISLSAKVKTGQASQPAGGPCGPCSFIDMKEGSSITVNNGGKLYAWGFITGKGTVLAKSGAAVYECFQFEDFRGGSQTTTMKNKVFPMSQYYVQNIEVPLTLESGATETVVTCFTMSIVGTQQPNLTFIAKSNAFFSLGSGTVTKWYDGSTDRLHIEINGNGSVSPISMKVSGQSIDSNDYVLPINGNITMTIKSGSAFNISQTASLLPGGQIIVEQGANCSISSGKSLYIYDADEWGTYCGSANKKLFPVKYAPGRTYTRTEADLVDAFVQIDGSVDASAGYVYTTTGGANVFSTGTGEVYLNPGTQEITYQLIQVKDNNNWVQIPITPAKLKNADGSFVETTSSANYMYADGKWSFKKCDEGQCVAGSDATCTEAAVCTKCGSVVTPALGHSHLLADTVYTVSEDNSTVTASNECSRGCGYVASATSTVQATRVPSTCKEYAYDIGVASFVVDWAESQEVGERLYDQDEPLKPHGPANKDAVTTVPGTCQAAGSKTYVCVLCNETQVEVLAVDPNNHVDTTTTTVAATCTENGYTKVTCACGHEVSNVPINALGHDMVAGTPVAPTCTAEGYTMYDCSRCDATEKKDIKTALGHDMAAATCVAPSTCKRTGCGYTEGGVDGNAHTGKTDVRDATAATCTADGFTGNTHCSDCGVKIKDGTTITALGHNKTYHVKVDSTCTATGTIEYWSCDRCGKNYSNEACTTEVSDLTIAMKAHSFTEKSEQLVSAATCKAPAVYKAKCATCTLVSDTEVVEDGVPDTTNGHNFTGDIKNDENGETHSFKCVNGCGDFGKATNHVYGAWEVTQEATCTEAGSKKQTCACGDVVTEVISKLDHSYNKVVTQPTCTEPGYTTYTCKNCGDNYTEAGDSSTGHSYSASWEWDDNKYILTLSCENCDDEITENGEVTAPESEKPATCSTPGEVVYKVTVSVSGVQFTGTNTVTIPATGHTYDEPTWKFTKTDDSATAVATFTCSECEAGVDDHSVSVTATEVTEAAGKVLPTCVSEGSVQYTATVMLNNKSYTGTSEAFTLAKPDHNKTFTAANTATCVDTGNKDYWYCASCKIFYKDEACTEAYGKDEHILPIDLDNGHDYDDGWKKNDTHHWHECANDCDIKGSEAPHEWAPATFEAPKTCRVCGATEGEKLVALAQIKKADDSIVKYESFDGALKAAVEGDTIVLLADAVSNNGFYPIELPTNGALDLNGKTFTGTATKIMMNGGTLNTYADDGKTIIPMAGPANAMYLTTDAVFVLDTDWSMTVESGNAELGVSWQTMPGQTVTIGENANVTIPANLTFTVRGHVIVNGKLTCNGTIVLENADATLTAAEGVKVTTTVENAKVVRENGVYVVHVHSFGTDWESDKDNHWHECVCGDMKDVTAHADETTKDHKCDVCDATLSECADNNNDHNCDVCGTKLTDCADKDKNHKCDVCDAEMGTHAAAEGKHTCDYCGETVTQCADKDKNHKCDVCDAEMGTHAAAEGKHTCDYCGETVTQCTDNDKDHDCDVCGTKLSECTYTEGEYKSDDSKHWLVCDVCGVASEATEEHTYTDGKCVCGAVEPVEEVVPAFGWGQTSQLYLAEPWALRANLSVYHLNADGSKGKAYTIDELNQLTDYGVYFIRESDLGLGDVGQDDLTVNDIINHPEVSHYTNADGKVHVDNSIKKLSCDFDEGIYTYQFYDSIYVLYYVVKDGVRHYAPIRERNISDIINVAKDDASFKATERAIYAAMTKLEQHILEKLGETQEELPAMKAPTLKENPLVGTLKDYQTAKNDGTKFAHTTAVVLVEPWGLELNGYVKLSGSYDDYGVIVYFDPEQPLDGIPTPEELISLENARIFSHNNGDVTAEVQAADGRTKISALYNSGLYTYQMDVPMYVMFYVQDGDTIYYGPVKERSVRSSIETRLGVSGVANTPEGKVLLDMIEMYEAVKAHVSQ